jgi:uncharacterized repeat protein (TIGR01451 family)
MAGWTGSRNERVPAFVGRFPARLVARTTVVVWLLMLVLSPQVVRGGLTAGYSEYYIPGGTDQLWGIFQDLDNDPPLVQGDGLHSVIAVTAYSDNTTIYYDHWEDGYDFDPANPVATADEIRYSDEGVVQEFESSNVPVPRGTTEVHYDGRDRIYVAGGPVSVTRASWPESIGTVFALAWEVYPVKPFLMSYTIPVGEDLFTGTPAHSAYRDFERVYVIVQSTSDGTTVVIDDPGTPGVDVNTVLAQGGVTELYGIDAGTTVSATSPVQVQFIVGRHNIVDERSEIRGYTAVPDDLWDNEYYNPVGGFATSIDTWDNHTIGHTNLYLYNPNSSDITILFEDSDGSGSFDIPAGGTLSYYDGAGRYVPQGSGVHLSSFSEFWGIGSADAESFTYDWGYSLVPAYALETEYYLGWAPGSSDAVPTDNGSPVFLTPVQDDTTIYVDYSPTNGAIDLTITVDRLETVKIFDPDNENTGMHIWATGPLALAWGGDPDTAEAGRPFLDLGYTMLPPFNDWMDEVLGLVKTVDPPTLSMGPGNAVTVTLVVPTYAFIVSDVVVTDTLSPEWNYVADSTNVIWPDGTVITGTAANPTINGQELVWDSLTSILPPVMQPQEQLTITFQAETTADTPGGYNINEAEATGTTGTRPDVFTARDSDTVYLTSLTIDKDTTTPIVNTGEVATYTIAVNSDEMINGAVITDFLPSGFTYLAGSVQGINVTRTVTTDPNVGDSVPTWGMWDIDAGGALTITFSVLVNAGPGTYDNTALIDSPSSGPVDDAGTAAQDAGTPAGRDPEPDEDVTVPQPTAVELLSFVAQGQPDAVLAEWQTAVEIDNYGFSLRRGTSNYFADAQEIAFIPAAGHGTSGGASYSYTDRAVQAGTRYVYWLVDIDTEGRSTVHGPAIVTSVPSSVQGNRIYLPLIMR